MEQAICSIADCEKLAVNRRGWCAKHYGRWRNHGDPEKTLRIKKVCAVEGCDRYCRGQGYCGLHYDRWRQYGDPLKTKLIPADQRFWSKVDRRGPDECWPWKGALDADGYGRFWFEGRTRPAARLAYRFTVGPIPEGYTIDHVRARGCVRPDCSNPAHLEAVPPGVNTLRADSYSGVNARKTHCIRGHEFSPENTYVPPKRPRSRNCKKCRKLHEAKSRLK